METDKYKEIDEKFDDMFWKISPITNKEAVIYSKNGSMPFLGGTASSTPTGNQLDVIKSFIHSLLSQIDTEHEEEKAELRKRIEEIQVEFPSRESDEYDLGRKSMKSDILSILDEKKI
jgi:hypothetical protein